MSNQVQEKPSLTQLAKKFEVSAEEMAQALATGIYDVTQTHEFISGVLQCLNITYSYEVPTAGVMFETDHKRWQMYINPHFFCKKLNQKQRKAVLVHEIAHILNKHPFRIPFIAVPDNKRTLLNIACDMAINQYIPDIPKGCSQCPPMEAIQQGAQCPNELCPGMCVDLNDYYDEDETTKKRTPWPAGKTSEFYYEKLLTKFKDALEQESDCDECGGDGQEKDEHGHPTGKPCPSCKGKGKKGKGKGLPKEFDSHQWDANATETEMLDATEELVQRAMVKRGLSHDKLPGAVQDLLQEIKQRRSELNYKGIIMSALKRHAAGFDRTRTWTRKSKRYGWVAPGTKNSELPKLRIIIDSSGSISIEELNSFLDIVDEFLKVGSRKCEICFFHTSMYHKQPYKKGERFDRKKVQSGGTDLTDTFQYMIDNPADLSVIITDGCYSRVDYDKMLRSNQKMPQVQFIISSGGDEKHPMCELPTVKVPRHK